MKSITTKRLNNLKLKRALISTTTKTTTTTVSATTTTSSTVELLGEGDRTLDDTLDFTDLE